MRHSELVCVALLLAGCGQSPTPPRQGAEASKQAAAPVKILHFYAGSAQVPKGEPVTLWYGVENATSVRVEPPVQDLKPGYNRSFQATPERTTTYRLVAEGAAGGPVDKSVTVEVTAAAGAPVSSLASRALFTSVFCSATGILSGQSATICYGAPRALSVSIDPAVQPLKPAARFCFEVKPSQTTTYTLTARGPDGRAETQRLIIKVQ
jgi:hypothetical protein